MLYQITLKDRVMQNPRDQPPLGDLKRFEEGGVQM